MRCAVVTLLALLSLPTATASAQVAQVQLAYDTYATGVEVMQLDAFFGLGPWNYQIDLDYHTTGLVGLLYRGRQTNTVRGVWEDERAEPSEFFGEGVWRGRRRRTLIGYTHGLPQIKELIPSPADADSRDSRIGGNRIHRGKRWRFAMAAAIALRGDCDSGLLRELAKQSEDADQVRRLLALAVVYDGGSRSDGARAGGVGLQTFRDWVLRFNAAGPTGLVDGKAPGQAPRLDQAQRDELARLIEDGPVPAVHGVVRWRLSDLAQWVMERYRTSVSEQTLSRYLRTMGYRKLSARPRHHAQNPEAVSAFKKTSLNVWQRSRLAMHRASR